MGLATSHDAFRGPYRFFMYWREQIAHTAGLPPLRLMEGYYFPLPKRPGFPSPFAELPTLRTDAERYSNLERLDEQLPIRWDCLRPSALHILLRCSDCEGSILPKDCRAIANELEPLIPMLPDAWEEDPEWYRRTTEKFVAGLRKAHKSRQRLRFF